ncbi:MAG: TetR/AcrR family transcriptional regulator C-terminal domain-containing protein [Candidatus Dormibacteraeota bacterium]|nr:TetR/AcrR family transcriptional regulator C-terminal domain-containing protein [Candidatus Dormibacteraeota bacterium]
MTEPRTPLTRDRVLHAAIRLADQGGIESLTMRKLGDELGVMAMSLYNHVADKDAILDGLVDLVLEEIEFARAGQPWKASLRSTAISVHAVVLRHPWSCSLIMSRFRPARVRYIDWVLTQLRDGGFTAEVAYHAYHALDSHILVFTLWQVGHGALDDDVEEEATAFLAQLPADQYPYFAEHARQHMSEPDLGGGEFEFGLDLILDGLERLR